MAANDTVKQLLLQVDAQVMLAQRKLGELTRQVDGNATEMDRSLARVDAASERLGRSIQQTGQRSGAARAGMQQLSFQVGDVAAQMSNGTRISVIFAQQIGQVSQAVQLMSGGTGRFAAFMQGPWGAAVVGATSVLGALVAMFGRNTEEEERATAARRRSNTVLDIQKASLRELIDLVDQHTDALRRNIQTERGRAVETLRTAEQARNAGEGRVRAAQQALLTAQQESARANARLRGANPDAADTLSLRQEADRAHARVVQLTEQVLKEQRALGRLQEAVRAAEVPIIQRNVVAGLDAAAAATLRYEQALESLNARQLAGTISRQDYARALRGIEQSYRAETEAANAAQRRGGRRSSGQSGDMGFQNPAPGARETSGFGNRRDPITGRPDFHEGIDLAGRLNSRINAPADGVVIKTGRVGGYGNVVWIDHGNGIISELNHLNRSTVSVGDQVTAGQQVGMMGSTGRSTGSHLHWNVRTGARPDGTGGRYVNPRSVPAARLAAPGTRAQPTGPSLDELRFGSVTSPPPSFMADPNLAAEFAASLPPLREMEDLFAEMSRYTLPNMADILAEEDQRRIESFFNGIRADLAQGLADAIVNGRNLGDVLVDTFRRAATELLSTGLMDMLSGRSRGDSFFSHVAGAIGFGGKVKGGRAIGGPIETGLPYLVGERGPEVVIPRTPSVVIPRVGSGGGSSVTVVNHIDAKGAEIGVEQKIVAALQAAAPHIAARAKAETIAELKRPRLGR